jgi:zinc protease
LGQRELFPPSRRLSRPPAHVDAPARPRARRSPFEKQDRSRTGSQLILHRDPSLPMVAVNLWYHVGPAYEPPGRSGFAHLSSI